MLVEADVLLEPGELETDVDELLPVFEFAGIAAVDLAEQDPVVETSGYDELADCADDCRDREILGRHRNDREVRDVERRAEDRIILEVAGCVDDNDVVFVLE